MIELIPAPSHSPTTTANLGSLTTPPCYESVIWTISHETIEIAEEQVRFIIYSKIDLFFL
ncbi:hypothetical protein DPMN_185909 [Dreissena polymorpha]|uniref:Alpha-carbonic anhydrase domain-containing protein n=1 Tax=Dreissena polymorpha TaxID=45954 RepID=A0A9D4DN55_DREPO|nr:hypothetical protein DPMN_185909 [Dreissena polymorpha]